MISVSFPLYLIMSFCSCGSRSVLICLFFFLLQMRNGQNVCSHDQQIKGFPFFPSWPRADFSLAEISKKKYQQFNTSFPKHIFYSHFVHNTTPLDIVNDYHIYNSPSWSSNPYGSVMITRVSLMPVKHCNFYTSLHKSILFQICVVYNSYSKLYYCCCRNFGSCSPNILVHVGLVKQHYTTLYRFIILSVLQ